MVRIDAYASLPEGDEQFAPQFIQQCGALVLSRNGREIEVGLTDPDDLALRMEISRFFQSVSQEEPNISFRTIDNSELASYIHIRADREIQAEAEYAGAAADRSQALDRLANNAPIINLVNGIILNAVRSLASDIHIERQKHEALVRYRLDGVLAPVRTIPGNIFPGVATRIKIMAGLNIMESRRPQDGRISVTLGGRSLDIRVSVVPTANGESLVLRILNLQSAPRSLDTIGFTPDQLAVLKRNTRLTQGLILLTGPTGSGKTTTLNAMISSINDGMKKIITIEDPVEFQIDGVDQIQTNDDIGLSFSSILRRILRQDPNVIMVGEIRDEETAQLSIRAAMTGHLVLSSLHTNTAVGSIQRLLDMGIQPYLLAGVLKTVSSQRLVRKLCMHCRKAESSGETLAAIRDVHKKLHLPPPAPSHRTASIFVPNPEGCSHCGGRGYSGRTVVSEIVEIDRELEYLIEKKADQKSIHDYLQSNAHRSLASDVTDKVLGGVTSWEEAQSAILVNV